MFKLEKRPIFIAKIVVTTIGVLIGNVESTLAREPQRVVSAPVSELSSVRLSDLETAFWLCDYLATTGGTSDLHGCSTITEAFKERKFAGDSDKLVDWWRQNKVAQHRNVAAADRLARVKGGLHE